MSRRLINDGQEIINQDLNDLQALKEQEFYDRVLWQMLQRVDNAFFKDSFKGIYVSSNTISVNAGLGLQAITGLADTEPSRRPIYLASASTQVVEDPDTVDDRIDLICVKSDRVVNETSSRKYKATVGGSVTTTTFNVRDDWTADLQVVTGTPDVSPVAPAVPSGYIALLSVLVHAVTGIGSQGDITDLRAKLPVGGDVVLDTTGFQRVPAASATPLSSIISAIDALLKQGYQNYTDFDVLGSDPAAPASSKVRVYQKGGVFYFRDSSAVITPLGSGGGGGSGGAAWNPSDTGAPLTDTEFGEKVWLFDAADAGSQKLTLYVKVPQGYIAGRQILMYIGQYSPSTSGTQLLRSVASLVRREQDAAGSTANQRTSTNTAIAGSATANLYHQPSLDLTDATGKVNGFSVSPGDVIRVDLVRGTDTDTGDIRFIPSATEVKFS